MKTPSNREGPCLHVLGAFIVQFALISAQYGAQWPQSARYPSTGSYGGGTDPRLTQGTGYGNGFSYGAGTPYGRGINNPYGGQQGQQGQQGLGGYGNNRGYGQSYPPDPSRSLYVPVSRLGGGGGYPSSQYPTSQYPTSQYPTSQYPQTQYPQSQYPQSQYPQSQYPQSQYPTSQNPMIMYWQYYRGYPAGQQQTGQYPQSQYPTSRYPTSQVPQPQTPAIQYYPYYPSSQTPAPSQLPPCYPSTSRYCPAGQYPTQQYPQQNQPQQYPSYPTSRYPYYPQPPAQTYPQTPQYPQMFPHQWPGYPPMWPQNNGYPPYQPPYPGQSFDPNHPFPATHRRKASAIVHGADRENQVQGTVEFEEVGDRQVVVKGRFTGLKPGAHGLHVHEKELLGADCGSVGDHFNPLKTDHGSRSSWKRHVGDLGNVFAQFDGVAIVEFTDTMISLTGPYSVVNKTLVITEKGDDFGVNPDLESKRNGNSGRPIACGPIAVLHFKK